MFFGLIILTIGVIAFLVHAGILSGSIWGYFWPIILIWAGLAIIFRGFFWRSRWRRWNGRFTDEDDEKK